ncbi:MAG: lysophospholipid acyltransferase family protein [Hoeflea sp.]|uniref:lysophospholipid acyltransferase family protein n=1 Tax=Hoeflea sp. TaxID=1940281 RepID=UPI003EF31C80
MAERWRQLATSIGVGLVAGSFTGILRLWSAVLRKDTSQLGKLDRYVAEGHQVLAVFWHGKYLPLFPLAQGKQAVVITIQSFRGRVIGEICKSFGYRPVLLPVAAKAHGFPALVQQVRERASLIALAVDGPTGPYHRIRSGAINLSAGHGVVLVPVGVASSRKIVLRSRWDKQEMPLPFSRVAVAVGALIDLSQYGETARLEDVVSQAMEAVERDASDILAGMT